MPGRMPPTSQLDWFISTTAMIVLFWSRATRDLLRSFGWGIAALLRETAATPPPFHRRPPPSVFRSRSDGQGLRDRLYHPAFLSPPRFSESGAFCCRSRLGLCTRSGRVGPPRNPAGVILMNG